MKRESIGKILERLDERVDDRPFPADSCQFDTSRRYRIISGDDLEYADKLADAKYTAGCWQIEVERIVYIIQQKGKPRRWLAILTPTDDVRLRELFSDAAPEDSGSRRLSNLARYISREERRRKRKMGTAKRTAIAARKVKANKFCSGHRRGIVCMNATPPMAFAASTDAARWVGVNEGTMRNAVSYRSGRCAGFLFKYADQILSAPQDFAAAIVEAAHEAMRLSGREGFTPKEQDESKGIQQNYLFGMDGATRGIGEEDREAR